MLLTGKRFLAVSIAIVVGTSSFVGLLYLFDWSFTSTASWGSSFFVTCWLPFLLAALGSIALSVLVMCCIGSVEWLSVFVLGAASGAFGMLVIRNFFTASNPSLASDPNFFWYWIALGVVALLSGLLAICYRKSVVLIATVLVGAYLFSSAIMGMFQLYVVGGVSGWWFYAIFAAMAILGLLVQVYVFGSLKANEVGDDNAQKQLQKSAPAIKEFKGVDLEKGRAVASNSTWKQSAAMNAAKAAELDAIRERALARKDGRGLVVLHK